MNDTGVEYSEHNARDLSDSPTHESRSLEHLKPRHQGTLLPHLMLLNISLELVLASLKGQNINIPALGVTDLVLLPLTGVALRRKS